MKLSRLQMIERQSEFPTMLRQLSYNNMIVNRIIEAYVHGAIATKEEAYCQMIIELSKTRDELMDGMINEAHLSLTIGQASTLTQLNPK